MQAWPAYAGVIFGVVGLFLGVYNFVKNLKDYSGSDVKTKKIKKIMCQILPIRNLTFLRTKN